MQILFILFGLITFVWSIINFFLLPDAPEKARFLTPAQSEILRARVQSEQHTSNNGTYKVSQAKEALLDPKSWLFGVFIFCTSAPSGALSNVSYL
jgi:hypothetical protein